MFVSPILCLKIKNIHSLFVTETLLQPPIWQIEVKILLHML